MFYERYVSLCLENNLEPTPAAVKMGLSSASATKWKNGQLPRAKTLNVIAKFFNVPVSYLTGETDIKKENPAANATGLEWFDSLNPSDQEAVKTFAAGIRAARASDDLQNT